MYGICIDSLKIPLLCPLVNILEVLPKDKKAKEEKTAVLGQASLDLLPTLLGESHPSPLTLTLHTITEGGGTNSTESSETVSTTIECCIVTFMIVLVDCRD